MKKAFCCLFLFFSIIFHTCESKPLSANQVNQLLNRVLEVKLFDQEKNQDVLRELYISVYNYLCENLGFPEFNNLVEEEIIPIYVVGFLMAVRTWEDLQNVDCDKNMEKQRKTLLIQRLERFIGIYKKKLEVSKNVYELELLFNPLKI